MNNRFKLPGFEAVVVQRMVCMKWIRKTVTNGREMSKLTTDPKFTIKGVVHDKQIG